MAKLVDVWRDDDPVDLTRRQMPFIVDENLTMVMDINGLGAICDSPLVCGKELDEFTRKFNMLTKEEIKASFEVTCKDMLAILGQAVPCVGCRRSVERLFYDLMKSGHPALDPLVITPEGLLSIKDDVLESPQLLCTMLQGHSTRLNSLVEGQPRNKKSRRCVLHSLEIQRMRPPPSAWKEVWDCMDHSCRLALSLIESNSLEATLDTYLRKHRFCGECRTKVLLAFSLLTTEPEPEKEKGYVASLYYGIRRCIRDRHVHIPTNPYFMDNLMGRIQPELMGRERHAKTLEIAQEEVLTCLAMCVAERLHRIHRRLREEETVCKVLAAVAVDALSRNFQMAVEVKQGISQLELLYEELTREEIAKQQRREKLRLKRKKKKERRYEIEEKENTCDCSSKKQSGSSDTPCVCGDSKPTTQNIDQHKLQVLDPKNKGPPTCKCPDCVKKSKSGISRSQSQTQLAFPKKSSNMQKNTIKKHSELKTKIPANQTKKSNIPVKNLSEELFDACESCKDLSEKIENDHWHNLGDYKDSMTKGIVDAWIGKPSKRCNMWIEMKKRFELSISERKSRSSSEQSSQDCGYSSEHNISSSSLPSTPEGSEVACSDGCCNHERDCHDIRPSEKLVHSSSSISFLKERGGGLTLTQMLEDSYLSGDEEKESYIPAEEVLEFKSRMCNLLGRPIDKSFEQMVQTEKDNELNQAPRNHVEHECIPPSLRFFSGNEQVDLARKMQEDPLYAIKKKEMETRNQLLKNPVKLKQLRQLLEQQSKKSKSEKKKKKNKQNIDSDDEAQLDLLLATKYKQLKDKISNKNLIKSMKKVKHKRKKKSRKENETSNSESESSNEGSESDEHIKKHKKKRSKSKEKNTEVIKHSKEKYLIPDKEEERKHKSYEKLVKACSSNNDNNDSSIKERRDRSFNRDARKHRDKDFRSSSPQNRRSSVHKNTYNTENKYKDLSKRSHEKETTYFKSSSNTNRKYYREDKNRDKWNFKKKQDLTEEEKERRRQEMIANATWRDEERERNVKKYRIEEKKEIDSRKVYNQDFVTKQLAAAAEISTVASRIKANINNIQRSGRAMDTNFAKR